MNTHELAWAAGLFDGEGHIRADLHSRSTTTLCPRIEISQVDRYVLDRFRLAVGGLGRVYGPYVRRGGSERPNSRPKHEYVATDLENVQAIMAMLWRWLSPIKRAQATAAFTRTREMQRAAPGRPKTRQTCKNGHEKTPENIRERRGRGGYIYRFCRACGRMNTAKARTLAQTVSVLLEATLKCAPSA